MDLVCQLFQESMEFEQFVKTPKAQRCIILARNNGKLGRLDTGLVDYR